MNHQITLYRILGMKKYFCPITSFKEFQLLRDLDFQIQYVGIVLHEGVFSFTHLVVVFLDDGPGDPPE